MSLTEKITVLAQAVAADIKSLIEGEAQAHQVAEVTETVGESNARSLKVDFNPSDASAAQQAAYNFETTFNKGGGGNPSVVGGWAGVTKSALTFYSNSNVDKAVGNSMCVGVGANSNISKILGYEFVLNAVASTANVGAVAGFYFPRLEGVPNTEKIAELGAFINDDSRAYIKSNGSYYKTMDQATSGVLRELAPPKSVGLRASRYYGAVGRNELAGTLDYPMPAGTVIPAPIYLPRRATIESLALSVSAGAPGALLKLALYHTNDAGGLGHKIYETGDLAASGSGVIGVSGVGITLEAGMYFLCAIANASITIKVRSNVMLAELFGSSTPDSTEFLPIYSLYAYPPQLPANASDVTPNAYLAAFCPEVHWAVSA